MMFPSGQKLGGHAKKMHLGLSNKYVKKRITREKRVTERAIHKMSKEITL